MTVAVMIPFLIGLAIAVFWSIATFRTIVSNDQVDGTVVSLAAEPGESTVRPVIEYIVDGETYQVESSVSYGGDLVPAIGDRRGVYYDPDDPSDASIESFLNQPLFPILLLAFSGGAVVVGVVILIGISRGRFGFGADGTRTLEKKSDFDSDPTFFGNDDGLDLEAGPADGEPELAQGDVPPRPARRSRPDRRGESFVAEFHGVEPSQPSAEGTFRYRIKAVADGETYYSDWLDRDPSLQIMGVGNRVTVVFRDGGYVVDASKYE